MHTQFILISIIHKKFTEIKHNKNSGEADVFSYKLPVNFQSLW